MTPEERQLITGLFDRMRSYGTPDKDREAEAIIAEAVRTTPDASYMLVQSVLVQEHALKEAANRISQLEEQVRDLQGTGRSQAPASGSFLGGLLGGGRPVSQPTTSSVPPIGSRASPPLYDKAPPPSGLQASPSQQPASGGFMRSAMATATGVAGGMLAAGAIRDLMGGGQANASTAANTPNATTPNATSPAGNAEPASAQKDEQGSPDNGYQDAADDDSSWDDDGGDFDLDI